MVISSAIVTISADDDLVLLVEICALFSRCDPGALLVFIGVGVASAFGPKSSSTYPYINIPIATMDLNHTCYVRPSMSVTQLIRWIESVKGIFNELHTAISNLIDKIKLERTKQT